MLADLMNGGDRREEAMSADVAQERLVACGARHYADGVVAVEHRYGVPFLLPQVCGGETGRAAGCDDHAIAGREPPPLLQLSDLTLRTCALARPVPVANTESRATLARAR